MKLLKLDITALSPLAFPERKAGLQFRQSLGYIPGATLYGALGGMLSEHHNMDDADEKHKFLNLFRHIRCHNAYPAWPGDAWSRPLPMTALRPKESKAAPVDALIERICYEYLEPAAFIFSPTDSNGRVWEGVTGFHAPPQPDDKQRQILRKVDQRVFTRVAINRRRGTAEDQLLYSPLALSEVSTIRKKREDGWHADPFPSRYIGSIVIPSKYDDGDDDDDRLRVEDAIGSIERVGGRTTTGMGQVTVNAHEAAPDTAAEIRQRVEQFNAAVQQRLAVYSSLGGTPRPETNDKTLFPITLLADALLYEHGWCPTMTLTVKTLQDALHECAATLGMQDKYADSVLDQPEPEVELIRSFASYGYVGGWNIQWDTHKPVEVSTRMGSVFVFASQQALDDTAYALLAHLQLQGIGERRAEGYGQVRVCDEFHIQNAFALNTSGEAK